MTTRRIASSVAALVLACAPAFAQVRSNAEIRQILADRVGPENQGVAIVVGVIDANGRRVVAYGSLAKNDTRRLDGDTVFEIGSITKVFTSLLLMDMARKGELALTDPVSKFLPASVQVPERNGRKITLADLSTQSSGLPRMPNNFAPKDPNNPYADYSVQQMYDFLSGHQLRRDVGSEYEYSNLGVGLLGHVLSLRAGTSYEALVRSRITDPLGMTNTRITLTPDMQARLAVGHSATLAPVSNWDIPTFAGAGALRSTTNDMLAFLAANLGYVQSPLAQAMADSVSVRRSAGGNMEIAYGWHVQTRDGNSIIWHNGGTGGYRTYIGYDPKARAGIVVLSNISTPNGPDDIGRYLLNPGFPLLKVERPVERKETSLDTKLFDRYVGHYQLNPSTLITMSREGNRFYTQLTGQEKIEVFAEAETKFFIKAVDAQLTFDVSPDGAPTQVTLHQNGANQIARRLSDAEGQRALADITARAADVALRFKEQRQSAGTEAALRKSIEGLQRGQPDYDLMSPQAAAATREQLPKLKAAIDQFGALQSITFKGVGPAGADIYEARFERATTEWRISLGPDARIVGINFRAQ